MDYDEVNSDYEVYVLIEFVKEFEIKNNGFLDDLDLLIEVFSSYYNL